MGSYVFDDEVQPVSVSGSVVIENYFTAWRPVRGWLLPFDAPFGLHKERNKIEFSHGSLALDRFHDSGSDMVAEEHLLTCDAVSRILTYPSVLLFGKLVISLRFDQESIQRRQDREKELV